MADSSRQPLADPCKLLRAAVAARQPGSPAPTHPAALSSKQASKQGTSHQAGRSACLCDVLQQEVDHARRQVAALQAWKRAQVGTGRQELRLGCT